MQIREIDAGSEAEIDLVAQRMRDTLIEVEGPETGVALYTMDWLRDRVRWHLDPGKALAKVLLAVDAAGQIVGHTIVRRESTEAGVHFGLVSTTYVVPASRRFGIAQQLLTAGEAWMHQHALPVSATWTSSTNTPLIRLYARNGYAQVEQHTHAVTGTLMVKLEKRFDADTQPVLPTAGG